MTNNIKEFLTQITTLQEDSETLQEIKDILSNDGTITLVEQIKFLQENTAPTNILNLKKEIGKVRDSLDEAQSSHSSMYDDVSSAMRSLEDVPYDNDEIESALSRLDDLEALLTKEEEPDDDGVADGLEMDSETNEQKSSNYTQQ